MKLICLPLCVLVALPAWAQTTIPHVPSLKYTWQKPVERLANDILGTVILEGAGYDMAYVQVSSCALLPSGEKTSLVVPEDEEHLIIVKAGPMQVSFKDSAWTLGPGSIALLMPGEKYALRILSERSALYYLLKYRSRAPADARRGEASGGSFVKDWSKIAFRQHDRGGVRSYFERPTAMCKRFEMHVTTLKAGLKSHDPHTHRAEEIVLMLEDEAGATGKTEMMIGDGVFQGEAGDLYYIGSNLLHGIQNIGDTTCSYFAFQFE